jgi:hypothetical protein
MKVLFHIPEFFFATRFFTAYLHAFFIARRQFFQKLMSIPASMLSGAARASTGNQKCITFFS